MSFNVGGEPACDAFEEEDGDDESPLTLAEWRRQVPRDEQGEPLLNPPAHLLGCGSGEFLFNSGEWAHSESDSGEGLVFPGQPWSPPETREEIPLSSEYRGEQARGVRYLTPPSAENRTGMRFLIQRKRARQRARYEASVGNLIRRRGAILDTRVIKSSFLDRRRIKAPTDPRAAQLYSVRSELERLGLARSKPDGSRIRTGAATLKPKSRGNLDPRVAQQATHPDHQLFQLWKKWRDESLMWVCAKDEHGDVRFYSHVGKIHRFHHSTFTAGGPVIGAGEWIVRGGILQLISANSGHYRPSLWSLHRSVKEMASRGALHSSTKVMLWNTDLQEWLDLPAIEFVQECPGWPWKSHPDASD